VKAGYGRGWKLGIVFDLGFRNWKPGGQGKGVIPAVRGVEAVTPTGIERVERFILAAGMFE